MPGWMKHKLESRLPGEISITSDIYHPYGRKQRGTKSHVMKVKEESEKAGLTVNIQKTKIMASSPTTSWQIGKMWKQYQISFSWALKSMQTVTEATKLKDDCSLEEQLCQT